MATTRPRERILAAATRLFADEGIHPTSVDRVIAFAKLLYERHGATDRLEVVHPDCGHDFPDEIRERAYQLFEKHLR